MKSLRILFLALAVLPMSSRAADDAQDWTAFGHMLTLLQTAMRIGVSPSPDQAMADLLAGRNYEANQAIASLFAGATAEMPDEYRARVAPASSPSGGRTRGSSARPTPRRAVRCCAR